MMTALRVTGCRKEPSFSAEKEAKRLLSIRTLPAANVRLQWIKVLWFFLSRKNKLSCLRSLCEQVERFITLTTHYAHYALSLDIAPIPHRKPTALASGFWLLARNVQRRAPAFCSKLPAPEPRVQPHCSRFQASSHRQHAASSPLPQLNLPHPDTRVSAPDVQLLPPSVRPTATFQPGISASSSQPQPPDSRKWLSAADARVLASRSGRLPPSAFRLFLLAQASHSLLADAD